ncbi:NLR family CARD domain-containing protein 4 [Candoia aspera]|uniref:NLR family CARD domain-containing protein 4 n=1 Tax=Candoia aspera TaxID=51853 RepID=UPI002FD7FEBC
MDFLENNSEQLIQRTGMATIKKIVHCLFAKSVLSHEEKDSIICQKAKQHVSRKLIYAILKKGDKACDLLVRSFEQVDFFCFSETTGNLFFLNLFIAEGLKNLKKLNLLQLKEVTNVGDGMINIVKSVSLYLQELEEIYLVNCCILATAVEILNILPKMKILMFPWVDEVNVCLVKLEELERMSQLTKLGLKKCQTTNSEAQILSTLFAKASLRDLQHLDMAENCLTSEGWLTILKALTHLKKLTFLAFSQQQGFTPSALLVLALAHLISQLVSLQEIDLTGWQFDIHELREINKAKESHRNELQVIVS